MFEHFTFAASGRPATTSTSNLNSLWDATSIPTLSPHEIPTPTPSPLMPKSSIALSRELMQKQSPIADLASQLSEQTIKVEPTYLYDYEFGLPSPTSSNEAEGCEGGLKYQDEFPVPDDFPVVDTDMIPSSTLILSGLKYRSTRVYSTAAGSAERDFRSRRWKRQIASRMLCELGLDQTVKSLDNSSQIQNSKISTAMITSHSTTSPSEPSHENQSQIPQQIPPTPIDEGFFEEEEQEDADDIEAVRLFRLQRPAGIRKWRDVGSGMRSGVLYRSYYGGLDGEAERDGRPIMVPSVPRMRRKIGRRKRSREGAREGGGEEASTA